MKEREEEVMLLGDHSRKADLKFVMIMRCFGIDINLRMAVLLHVTVYISWIKGLQYQQIKTTSKINNNNRNSELPYITKLISFTMNSDWPNSSKLRGLDTR